METTPNLLASLGILQTEIDMRIEDVFHAIFEDQEERFYFSLGEDAGYMLDTGNLDVRTEGMHRGCVCLPAKAA